MHKSDGSGFAGSVVHILPIDGSTLQPADKRSVVPTWKDRRNTGH